MVSIDNYVFDPVLPPYLHVVPKNEFLCKILINCVGCAFEKLSYDLHAFSVGRVSNIGADSAGGGFNFSAFPHGFFFNPFLRQDGAEPQRNTFFVHS